MPGSYSHLSLVTASIIKHRGSNYNLTAVCSIWYNSPIMTKPEENQTVVKINVWPHTRLTLYDLASEMTKRSGKRVTMQAAANYALDLALLHVKQTNKIELQEE